jgi:hypothetical protein
MKLLQHVYAEFFSSFCHRILEMLQYLKQWVAALSNCHKDEVPVHSLEVYGGVEV